MKNCSLALRSTFLLLVAGGLGVAQSARSEPVVPVSKELVRYVQDARKLGLQDSELRQNAIKAGWKPDLVDEAMRYTASGKESDVEPESRTNRGVPSEYVIGESDVLQVSVWKELEASVASVAVRADGKITLPFVKDVVVAGLTPAQAEALITERLKPFIIDPDVSVIVREIHSKRIYLIGQVKKAGAVDLRYPMTVLQALTEAGGVTDFAKKKKIYILRTENGKQFRLPFDYDAVLRGQSMELNIWLTPGDLVIVP